MFAELTIPLGKSTYHLKVMALYNTPSPSVLSNTFMLLPLFFYSHQTEVPSTFTTTYLTTTMSVSLLIIH